MSKDLSFVVSIVDKAAIPIRALQKSFSAFVKTLEVTAGVSRVAGKAMVGSANLVKGAVSTVAKFTKGLIGVGKASQQSSKAMLNSSKQTKQAANNYGDAVKKMASVASAAKKLTVAFIGFKALKGALAGAQKFAEAFNTQESAANGLARALKLSGEFSDSAMEKHKKFAAAMQESANVGDEVTLGMMKQASMLGVSDAELENVTKTAIGLSEATGIELNTALKRTVGAMSGVFGELGEVIPEVRNARTEQEKLAAVTAIAAKGFEQKKGSLNSLSGIMTKARNTIGDLMEKIGEILSPILKVIYEGFHVMAQAVIMTIDELINLGGGLGNIETIARAFVQEVVKRFLFLNAMASTIFNNIPKVLDIALTLGKLKLIGFVEDFKHFFTTEIPAYARWFADNFFRLISDAFNNILVVVVETIKAIGNSIAALWKFVSSGFEGGFGGLMNTLADIGAEAGKRMAENFQKTTDPLPVIAVRQMTAAEKELTAKVDKMTGELADEFNEKLADRMNLLDPAAATDAGGLGNLIANKAGGGGKDKAANANAFESRLLTRGPGERRTVEDILAKIERNTEETKNNTKYIADNTSSPSDGEDETEISLELINGGQ